MNNVLKNQLGWNMGAYVDNMLVESILTMQDPIDLECL